MSNLNSIFLSKSKSFLVFDLLKLYYGLLLFKIVSQMSSRDMVLESVITLKPSEQFF
jgi:hypothetical protein